MTSTSQLLTLYVYRIDFIDNTLIWFGGEQFHKGMQHHA